MAVVAATLLSGSGQRLMNETTLTATNSLTYQQGAGQELIVRNPTGASINCTLDGDGGTTVTVPGVGVIDVSAGYTFAVAAGAARIVPLDTISAYLQGNVSITGTGLVASLLNNS